MRPQYHYAAAANWLSDPNGLVYHAGEWHLFYQYNPHGEEWGHMCWGHAISIDLVTWQEQRVAIAEDAQDMIFSGSAVVDADGTAGFGKDALVAIYTAAAVQGPQRQSQALAYSNDKGRSWHKFDGNPVIDRGMADFRDPNVFWHAPSQRWVMVVVLSNEDRGLIYTSSDLRHWDEASEIAGLGAPGHIWECPLLIELPVEGGAPGETRWLFKVDVLQDAPGSGAIYQTGTFDGQRFVPDSSAGKPYWHLVDQGRDFYAAIAWHEPRDDQGRPLWIGWIGNHAYQGQLPLQGWRGAMSVPRRISLVRNAAGYILRQEMEAAAIARVPLASLDSGECPLAARFDLAATRSFFLALSDKTGRSMRIERRGDLIVVTRRDPVTPTLDVSCKLTLPSARALTLWVDVGSIELIGDAGLQVVTLQHRMEGPHLSSQFGYND